MAALLGAERASGPVPWLGTIVDSNSISHDWTFSPSSPSVSFPFSYFLLTAAAAERHSAGPNISEVKDCIAGSLTTTAATATGVWARARRGDDTQEDWGQSHLN